MLVGQDKGGRGAFLRDIPRRRLAGWGAVALLLVLGIALLLKDGIRHEIFHWADERGYGYIQPGESLRQALWQMPAHLLSAERPGQLVLDVKFKHMRKIFRKREEALRNNLLVQGKDDFVPASIRLGIDRKVRAKIRLKGDFVDHLKGNKWSFRVHAKGKGHYRGMRRFSIQHPRTRGFQQEPLFMDMLRDMGVLAPRYSFVDLTLNGKRIGVMALEEHFSKEILEINGRKEGVIVRFDESTVFAARDGYERRMGIDGGAFDNFRNTYVDAFQTSKVAKSARLSGNYRYAVGVLRGFMEGRLRPSQVFDATLMAKLAAAADLWGAWHALEWRNIRFYLNPLTMRLEPIAYDANHDRRSPPGTLASQKSQLFREILRDPEIFQRYRKELRALADAVLQGHLVETLRAREARLLKQLRSEYFLLAGMDFEDFVKQARFIASYDFSRYWQSEAYRYPAALSLDELRDEDYPAVVQAYVVEDEGAWRLELAAAVPHEVEVTAVRLRPRKAAAREISPGGLPLRLPPLAKGGVPRFREIALAGFDARVGDEVVVSARILGYDKIYTLSAMPYAPRLVSVLPPVADLESQLSRHRFLAVDKAARVLRVLRGVHEVSGSLLVPAGYRLRIDGGTTLRFSRRGMVLSYGPVEFIGDDAGPVVLEPQQGVPDWQGVVVMRAAGPSRLRNVQVRHTKGIAQGAWSLTGGVTFYRSKVSIENSVFEDNAGEDALNIVHSDFVMQGVQMRRTASDAFDSDFSRGTLRGGSFSDIGLLGGGDAIDVSGTRITVRGTRFDNIGDKALSVGEQSTMTAGGVAILSAGTAAASKDGSLLEIEDSEIAEVRTAGLMAYVKKPEYGGARIVAKGIRFGAHVLPARAQRGSTIFIDGKPVPPEDINVKAMYETIMRPGLRR